MLANSVDIESRAEPRLGSGDNDVLEAGASSLAAWTLAIFLEL